MCSNQMQNRCRTLSQRWLCKMYVFWGKWSQHFTGRSKPDMAPKYRLAKEKKKYHNDDQFNNCSKWFFVSRCCPGTLRCARPARLARLMSFLDPKQIIFVSIARLPVRFKTELPWDNVTEKMTRFVDSVCKGECVFRFSDTASSMTNCYT